MSFQGLSQAQSWNAHVFGLTWINEQYKLKTTQNQINLKNNHRLFITVREKLQTPINYLLCVQNVRFFTQIQQALYKTKDVKAVVFTLNVVCVY